MLSYSFYKIGAVDYAGQIHWVYTDFTYQIVPVCVIWLAAQKKMIWLWKSESSMSQMSQDSSVTLDLICNIAIGYFVQ